MFWIQVYSEAALALYIQLQSRNLLFIDSSPMEILNVLIGECTYLSICLFTGMCQLGKLISKFGFHVSSFNLFLHNLFELRKQYILNFGKLQICIKFQVS